MRMSTRDEKEKTKSRPHPLSNKTPRGAANQSKAWPTRPLGKKGVYVLTCNALFVSRSSRFLAFIALP